MLTVFSTCFLHRIGEVFQRPQTSENVKASITFTITTGRYLTNKTSRSSTGRVDPSEAVLAWHAGKVRRPNQRPRKEYKKRATKHSLQSSPSLNDLSSTLTVKANAFSVMMMLTIMQGNSTKFYNLQLQYNVYSLFWHVRLTTEKVTFCCLKQAIETTTLNLFSVSNVVHFKVRFLGWYFFKLPHLRGAEMVYLTEFYNVRPPHVHNNKLYFCCLK